MKSRITESSFNSMTTAQRKLCQAYVAHTWKKLQSQITRRFMLALALALNDRYGWTGRGIVGVMGAVSEIIAGYSDDTYTPKEQREGSPDDIERMADAMKAELECRGIILEWD